MEFKYIFKCLLTVFPPTIITAEDWDHISEDAKSLIKRMLTYKFADRPSAQTCLNDPWIQKNAPASHLNPKCLQNLGTFHVIFYLK